MSHQSSTSFTAAISEQATVIPFNAPAPSNAELVAEIRQLRADVRRLSDQSEEGALYRRVLREIHGGSARKGIWLP